MMKIYLVKNKAGNYLRVVAPNNHIAEQIALDARHARSLNNLKSAEITNIPQKYVNGLAACSQHNVTGTFAISIPDGAWIIRGKIVPGTGGGSVRLPKKIPGAKEDGLALQGLLKGTIIG